MSEEKMSEIKILLEDIRELLLLSNQDKINEMKSKLLKPGSMEETVYNLCQEEISNEQIANEIKKDAKYVRAVTSNLRQKGLIKTIEKDGKKIHARRF